MADHELVITISTGGYLSGEIRCNASPDAECRNIPDCGCEAYSGLDQDDRGWFHTVKEDTGQGTAVRVVKHRHHPSDECNICNWLNAEDPMDCFAGSSLVTLPGLPIEPVWAGDFYEWKPAQQGAASATAE